MQQLDLFASLSNTSSQKKRSEEKQPVAEKKKEAALAEESEQTPFSLVELAEETLGVTNYETIQINVSGEGLVKEAEKYFVPFSEDKFIDENASEVVPSEEVQIAQEAFVQINNVESPEVVAQIEKEAYQPNAVRNGAVIFDNGKISVKVKSRPVNISVAVPIDAPAAAVPAEDITEKAKKEPQKRGRKPIKEIEAEADLIEVPEDEVLFQKQYYQISEVAKWFRVNTSLLRFWENEFDILKPRKNRKGDRLFRPEDVKSLQLIYQLLRQRKYTIEGAKDYIKTNRKKADTEMQLTNSLQKFRSFLLDLRANL